MKVRVLVLATTLLLTVAPVAKADPAGTVKVNDFPSLRPGITVLGASSAGLLYRVERPPYQGGSQFTYLKPAGKPAYLVPDEFKYLAGDKAYAPYTSDGHVHYLIVGTTVVRHCDLLAQPAPPPSGGFGPFTPFGWLSDFDNGVRVVADAAGCRVAGKATGVSSYNVAASDENGYVLTWEQSSNGDKAFEYHSFAAPDQAVAVQTGGRSRYAGGVAVDGDVITWSQLDYEDPGIGASYVVRSSASGGPATVTHVDGIRVGATAIAGADTGWAGCDENYSNCRGGTTSGAVMQDATSIAGDGSRLLFDTYGTSPGIDALAGEQRSRVATVGLIAPETFGISVGASTVAYVDNQPGMNGEQPLYGLSRRTYGTALAPQVSLGRVGTVAVARDGRRTAYVDTARDLWIVRDDGVRTKVFDAVEDVAQVGTADTFRLSGHRLLWVKDNYTGEYCEPWGCYPNYDDSHLMLYDVRTGKNTDLGPATRAALWGSYLVYTDSSNRILRKDLSSGAVVQVKGAGSARIAGLDVFATMVGWSTCAGFDNSGSCKTSRIAYRVGTTGSVVERASTHSGAVRITGGYLVHTTQETPSDALLLKAWRLGTQTVTTIGPDGGALADVHDETLAWIGADKVARLTPLAPFAARPRYLGDALGSASFAPAKGQAWTPEFAISKALPTCKITITTGTTVRRTMSCATTVGAARATWNGRDSAGRLLPKGTYTWTLTGSDSDGSLLWWTGTATPIRGTVTIT